MTDMEKMQAEAVNNARAMYKRRTPMRQITLPANQSVPSEEPLEETDEKTEFLPSEAEKQTEKSKSVLAPLLEDAERTLIILLMILLYEDGADYGVLMALMYCIL